MTEHVQLLLFIVHNSVTFVDVVLAWFHDIFCYKCIFTKELKDFFLNCYF